MPMNKTGLLPVIDPTRCTGCGWCVAACPELVLHLEPRGWSKHSVLRDAALCTGCRKCERRCWFGAIDMLATDAMAANGPTPSIR